jgi:hypothetical protein
LGVADLQASLPNTIKSCGVFKDERVFVFGRGKTRPLVDVLVEETHEFERIVLLASVVLVSAMKIAFTGVASKPD